MNVTYLIGNGFDIACGLKTSYQDFIQTYLKIISDDADICEFKSYIEQNLRTWADAEFAFGMLTEHVISVHKFKKCFRDFLSQLHFYFSNQQSKMRYTEIKKYEKYDFMKGLKDFQLCLSDESRKEIASCVRCIDSSCVTYNFLVFTYTEVFETYLRKSILSENSKFEPKLLDMNPNAFHLGSIEYVHGNLLSTPLIFGVNDTDQIKYLPHKNNSTVKELLVKPIGNEETHRLAFERCKNIVHQSDIICTYGMSIGLTDSIWWNEILTLLSNNKKLNLLIHYWNPACNTTIAGDVIETTADCKNKFISNAKSEINSLRSMKDRIHVVINKNPFHLSAHSS